ncbi:Acyl-CoA:1-acyl-sn-glycerol-3-phosphate acyltransferase [hydrothermal vent metagenome]|uniref:Acyl-CoA:1-acyl-sn-glycerol-3-phosphate acyltransferase n=1 Tax=hydrothermal vent metagenome TaxID=652676 RepID=A0A3B0XBS8_9ZZZZ
MNSKPVLFFRSLLFWMGFIVNVVVFGLLIVFLFFTSSSFRLKIARLWSLSNNFLLKFFCGIDFKVEGKEHLNDVKTAIILCKHQSTWETLALHSFTPYVRWVFKRELMYIPVFGWALALTDPIAINRGAGRAAIKQLISEGTKKLNKGKWMVLFPEGTRTQPGKTRKYKIGGALLAEKSGYPIIPIAHNAGEFWPKHSFIKWPGTITVVIGSAIEPKERRAEEINAEVFDWIESAMKKISPDLYAK